MLGFITFCFFDPTPLDELRRICFSNSEAESDARSEPSSFVSRESNDPVVTRPLSGFDSTSYDAEMVRVWAEQNHTTEPIEIEPLDRGETYRVSRFRLNNGKLIRVYTIVPESSNARPVNSVSY